MASFLMDYDELFANSAGGFDRVDRAGQELGSPTRGFVEEKATLNTFWELGDFSAMLSLRYLSSLTEQCVGLVVDFELTDLCCPTRAGPSGDQQARQPALHRPPVRLGSRMSCSAADGDSRSACRTCTDEEPPICYSCDLNSLDGTIYPIAGQFWYLRASFQN